MTIGLGHYLAVGAILFTLGILGGSTSPTPQWIDHLQAGLHHW